MAPAKEITGQDWIDLTSDLAQIKEDLEGIRQFFVAINSDKRFMFRELYLALTKVDEGIMWLDRKLQEALDELGARALAAVLENLVLGQPLEHAVDQLRRGLELLGLKRAWPVRHHVREAELNI